MLSQLENRASSAITEASSLLATVLFEDVESGLRARALMESVEANMDFPAEFQLDLWRFDWLAERSLGNIALSRADRSALVLISVGSANTLPPAAENWLNTWVEMEQNHPLALVVLIPKEKRTDDAYHSLHEQLRAAARRKGVDFFCEFFEPSSRREVSVPTAGVVDETMPAATQTRSDHDFEFSDPEPIRMSSPRPVRAFTAASALGNGESKEGAAAHSVDILNKVTLSDMSPKTRRQSGLPNDCDGVVVACIDSASPAFKAGLRVGDVIQQMDEQDVKAAADAFSLSHQAKGKNVLLRVWSQGDSRFLVVNRSPSAGKPLCS